MFGLGQLEAPCLLVSSLPFCILSGIRALALLSSYTMPSILPAVSN